MEGWRVQEAMTSQHMLEGIRCEHDVPAKAFVGLFLCLMSLET